MKLPRPLPVVIAALLLAVGAIAAACGGNGNGELTIEEYFEGLQAIADDVDERGQALESDFERLFDPATSESDSIEAAQNFFNGSASIFTDGISDLENLGPPPEVGDAHNEFVEAAKGIGDAFQDFAERAGDIESVADVQEMFAEFGTPEFAAVEQRFEAACKALEGIASDSDIELDMNC
jgi:UDP-N-acetylglucosamine enolpyruvyl transferase